MILHVRAPHALLGLVALGLTAACSTTIATSTPDSTATPSSPTAPDGENASDAGAPRPDARADAAPDAGTTADASAPDPACDRPSYWVITDDHATQADALVVAFDPNMAFTATFSSPPNGGSPPRWFAFDVPTAQVVDLSFDGSRAQVDLYFEAETSARLALWSFKAKQAGASLEPGRWYVKFSDSTIVSHAPGATADLLFKSKSAPPCVGP
jgi:hypothetical protein